eukprot:5123481-Pleurochrysis_carterae.AAC.1
MKNARDVSRREATAPRSQCTAASACECVRGRRFGVALSSLRRRVCTARLACFARELRASSSMVPEDVERKRRRLGRGSCGG